MNDNSMVGEHGWQFPIESGFTLRRRRTALPVKWDCHKASLDKLKGPKAGQCLRNEPNGDKQISFCFSQLSLTAVILNLFEGPSIE